MLMGPSRPLGETVNPWGIRPGRPRRWPRRSRTARHPSRRSRPTPWRPPSPRPPAASRTEPLSFNRPLRHLTTLTFQLHRKRNWKTKNPSNPVLPNRIGVLKISQLVFASAGGYWLMISKTRHSLAFTAFTAPFHVIISFWSLSMILKYADWMHWGEHVWTGVFGAAHQSVHLKRDCVLLRHLSFMKNMKTDHHRSLFSSQWAERERSHCFAERRCTMRKLVMADLQLQF